MILLSTPPLLPSKNLPAKGGSVLLLHLEWYRADTNQILETSVWAWVSFQCGLPCLCTNNLQVIPHTRELCKQITSRDILLEVNDVQNLMSCFPWLGNLLKSYKKLQVWKPGLEDRKTKHSNGNTATFVLVCKVYRREKTNRRKEMTGRKAMRGGVVSVDPASTVLFWSNNLPLGQDAPHLHTHLSEDV